jgi:hypothetical protein
MRQAVSLAARVEKYLAERHQLGFVVFWHWGHPSEANRRLLKEAGVVFWEQTPGFPSSELTFLHRTPPKEWDALLLGEISTQNPQLLDALRMEPQKAGIGQQQSP